MPRPRRLKVTSTAAPARVVQPKPPKLPELRPAASKIGSKTRPSKRAISTNYGDKSETAASDSPTFMSGALPVDTDPQQAKGQRSQTSAVDALKKRRDEALGAHRRTSGRAYSTRSTPSTAAAIPRKVLAYVAISPRKGSGRKSLPKKMDVEMEDVTECTPSPAQESDEEDLYGLSPSGEISQLRIQEQFAARRLSQQQQAPSVHGTPAADTSIFARFKRRPRQSSMMRMIQRESSAGAISDLDPDLEDFDLPPEDESTPLNLNTASKARTLSSSKSLSSGFATSSSRKRKFEEIQVPQSPPIASSPPSVPSRRRSPQLHSESSDLPEDRPIPSTEQPDPQIYSETMAEPLSSSSLALLAAEPNPTPRAAKHRKTRDGRSPAAPPAGRPTRRKPGPRATAFSTAQLQDLLPKPRRRTRAATRDRTPFEIPSSDSIAHDDNESLMSLDGASSPQAFPRRRTTAPAAQANPRTLGRTPGNATAKRPNGKQQPTPARPRARRGKTASPPRSARAAKAPKTYGRRSAADDGLHDKENRADQSFARASSPASSDVELQPRSTARGRRPAEQLPPSRELAAARRKFERVDEWELAFESVDGGVGEEGGVWR